VVEEAEELHEELMPVALKKQKKADATPQLDLANFLST